jgi:general secretion pathway protein D
MISRKINWALPAALAVLFFLSVPALQARGPSAKKLFQRGQLAETKDDILTAYEDYAQAFKLDPKNLRYKAAMERTRFPAASKHVSEGEKLRAQGDESGALTEYMRAHEIDPSNDLARQDIARLKNKLSTPLNNQETSIPPEEMDQLRDIGGPITLKPISNEPITLHTTEDSKTIYQTVGKLAGINVLFDPEYVSKRIEVYLSDVTLSDALRIVAAASGTFWKPITSNTIFVAQDTQAKHRELEDQAVQTFYLGNDSQQNDLNDILTALRDLVANGTGTKLFAVAGQNAIVMRGTPDELLLAQKIIHDLDKPRPEVVIDVSLLEVNRDRTRNIGLQWPNSFGVQLQPPNATTTTNNSSTTSSTTSTTQNLTLNNIAHLNATNFAVTVGAATANLLLSDSDTKVLQNPTIRASDGQQAELKIGERIPVATGSYQTGAATAIVSSLVNTQFTYQDVGVDVKITPTIHYNGDVTLKISVGSSEETGSTSIGGITEPIIAQDTTEQTVRLKNGEVNILGGFLQKENNLSVSGLPGLGELPILKYIFGSQTREVQDEEIIFMITPHVIRGSDIDPLNLRQIDTGTQNEVELRRIAQPAEGPAPGIPSGPAAALPPAAQPAPPLTGPPPAQAPPAGPGANGADAANPPGAGVTMQIAPPTTPLKVGSTFQVAVNLDGGKDVFGVPMLLHYDSSKLSLVNVDSGDYLGRDGQAVALVHRDDGHGMLVVSASRPPGVAGVNGGGTVCVLSFKATAAGDSSVAILRASAINSKQQRVDVPGSQATVHVQ